MAKKKSSKTYTSSNYQSLTRDAVNSDYVEERVDTAVRLFGMPHQMLPHVDHRLGIGVDLGRVFAETTLIEAPNICIKPGKAVFLPGKSDDDKQDWMSAILEAAKNHSESSNALQKMLGEDDDALQYYDHQGCYSEYMTGVNRLAHAMAVMLGVDDIDVPWAKNVTFGYYDWRYYKLGKQYADVNPQLNSTASPGDSYGWLDDVKLLARNAVSFIERDDQYLQFFVDASASFSESISNSTGQSMLESFTETLEGYAKELSMIAGIGESSQNISDAMNQMDSATNDFLAKMNGTGSSAFEKIIGKIGTGAKQIISGGNFQIPEIYQDSRYDKSYSFTITAATPYGNKLAWYLNVGVVLCHVLGFVLPLQLSANTYKSPYLLKCFSPGWFNCSLGIADSVGLEKGADQSWSVNGLPNELKISLSIKDLYSGLSLPITTEEFMENSGMMEFLMANCGLDVTNQQLEDKFRVWKNMLMGSLRDKITATPVAMAAKARDFVATRFLLFD